MPTLQQRGLQRPMDLADRTAETAARSPKLLSCRCHFDPRAALDFVSGCHCELTLRAPRLVAAEGEVGDEKDPAAKRRCRETKSAVPRSGNPLRRLCSPITRFTGLCSAFRRSSRAPFRALRPFSQPHLRSVPRVGRVWEDQPGSANHVGHWSIRPHLLPVFGIIPRRPPRVMNRPGFFEFGDRPTVKSAGSRSRS